jgi:C4-dicarboxylate-specific signal transduction histidine kinase
VLGTDRREILHELHALRDHVDHVKAIVSRQQAFATVRCVVEPCLVHELIEDALLMSHAAIIQHGVDVVREYHETPRVTLDISNARQSVVDADRAEKRITVRSRSMGDARIRIEVEDNGTGIAPEHHARVFTHGFTTKIAGHGIGLHSSALAASELHGTLTFASDGIDRGATFALELPVVPG